MRWKIKAIRRLKAFFFRCRLHVLFRPFNKFNQVLANLSQLSEWIQKNKKLPINDFPSSNFDYSKRFKLYQHVIDHELKDGAFTYLEFGVAKGASFKWWMEQCKNTQCDFHGFDTFTGLPEDWGLFKANTMTNDGDLPPLADDRGKFYKGLFQETLPGFIKKHSWSDKRLVVMMDADLYTSTLFVLTSLAPYLKKDDIILFDEFNVPRHEFLAFQNFVSAYYIKYEVLGAQNNYYFVATKLK